MSENVRNQNNFRLYFRYPNALFVSTDDGIYHKYYNNHQRWLLK